MSNTECNIRKADVYEAIRNKKSFTVLPSEVLQQLRDPIALAVWCYLQSLPPDWKIIKSQIRKHFSIGEKKCKSIFALLNDCKLIEYTRMRNADGTLGEVAMIIHDGFNFIPSTATGAKSSPVVTTGAIIHPVVNHTCGKEGTTNTIYKTNTNTNTYITETQVANAQNINVDNFIDTDYEYPDTLYGLEAKKQKKALAPAFSPQDDNPYDIPDQMIKDWKTIRNAKKSPVTKTAWNRLLKELKICEENGINAIDAFEEMISKSWISLKYEYFKKNENRNTVKNTTKNNLPTLEDYDSLEWTKNKGKYL